MRRDFDEWYKQQIRITREVVERIMKERGK